MFNRIVIILIITTNILSMKMAFFVYYVELFLTVIANRTFAAASH